MPSPRLRLRALMPEPYAALDNWHTVVEKACTGAGLQESLLDLVRLRVSQLNGCTFCMDLHSREARAHGERQARLDVLPGWRETGELFTVEERAALDLAESMTQLPSHGVRPAVLGEAANAFTAEQLGGLIMAISVINAYNRIGVSTGAQPQRRSEESA